MKGESFAKAITAAILSGFAYVFARNRKKKKVTWSGVKQVVDQGYLDAYEVVYNDVVDRIQAKYPNDVKYPICSRRVYVHPGPTLPAPYQDRLAVGFPEHKDGGNSGGNMVILEQHKQNITLWAHECVHICTGVTDHPKKYFGRGLSLNI